MYHAIICSAFDIITIGLVLVNGWLIDDCGQRLTLIRQALPVGPSNRRYLEYPPSRMEEHHMNSLDCQKVGIIHWLIFIDLWNFGYCQYRPSALGVGLCFFSGWCILSNRYVEQCSCWLLICFAWICVVCHGDLACVLVLVYPCVSHMSIS